MIRLGGGMEMEGWLGFIGNETWTAGFLKINNSFVFVLPSSIIIQPKPCCGISVDSFFFVLKSHQPENTGLEGKLKRHTHTHPSIHPFAFYDLGKISHVRGLTSRFYERINLKSVRFVPTKYAP